MEDNVAVETLFKCFWQKCLAWIIQLFFTYIKICTLQSYEGESRKVPASTQKQSCHVIIIIVTNSGIVLALPVCLFLCFQTHLCFATSLLYFITWLQHVQGLFTRSFFIQHSQVECYKNKQGGRNVHGYLAWCQFTSWAPLRCLWVSHCSPMCFTQVRHLQIRWQTKALFSLLNS